MSNGALVLLFSTTKPANVAARIHAADCAMVNTSGRKVIPQRFENGVDPETGDTLVEVEADLEERGYPVKRCKCCR